MSLKLTGYIYWSVAAWPLSATSRAVSIPAASVSLGLAFSAYGGGDKPSFF